ncbi:hypothetical protein C0Q70_01662 [Pomacea canaliculata]|uniref:Uncharacterized protein n=1 Tax=Pomacea canaliculata TaxID=400727 RepID=A0A2T7Q033_POMCA|nr:hypothetical protein C0Q70_01662 [Pomacea canaliculata]
MLPTVVCDCYGNPHGQRREGIPVVYRRILCPCRCPREDQEPDTALGQPVCDSTDARSPKRVHPAETKKAACLNGVCYSLSLAYMRIPFCECPEKYEGASDLYVLFEHGQGFDHRWRLLHSAHHYHHYQRVLPQVEKEKTTETAGDEEPRSQKRARPLSVSLPPTQLKVPQARKAEQEEYLTENGSTCVEMMELEPLNSTSNNISSRSEPQVS